MVDLNDKSGDIVIINIIICILLGLSGNSFGNSKLFNVSRINGRMYVYRC